MRSRLIVIQAMVGMRPATVASEAIEAKVSLTPWDVLHGTLRWASEASGRGLTEGLGCFASQTGW